MKLDTIRKTIEERTRHLKNIIDNQRQILAKHIDQHVENLEQMWDSFGKDVFIYLDFFCRVKSDNVDNNYQSIRERLPKILE